MRKKSLINEDRRRKDSVIKKKTVIDQVVNSKIVKPKLKSKLEQ